MTTFHSLMLNLVALQPGSLLGPVGELAHAAFYAMIQAVDADLSSQMHDAQVRAAFTLSPLFGFGHEEKGKGIVVQPGQTGWLRVTLLDDQLFAVLVRRLLTQSHPQIQLGKMACAITDIWGTPESHPWAGYTTLAALAAQTEVRQRWVVEFASPTAVRWGEADNGVRRVEVFPMPRMALAGLRSRWDKLTGETWGREFEEWVERNVMVGRVWRWETRPFAFQRQLYTGGLGKLEYRLMDTTDARAAAHLHRLLQLGFYAGIGSKTTHGMGQMRLVESS
jgi:CRISPR-associated endoribonuclease Cas6